MLERVEAMCEEDSDLDADVDIPPLDQIISWQVLKRIDPKLRKLQESINGEFLRNSWVLECFCVIY